MSGTCGVITVLATCGAIITCCLIILLLRKDVSHTNAKLFVPQNDGAVLRGSKACRRPSRVQNLVRYLSRMAVPIKAKVRYFYGVFHSRRTSKKRLGSTMNTHTLLTSPDVFGHGFVARAGSIKTPQSASATNAACSSYASVTCFVSY